MADITEIFVGIDIAKDRNAIAVADGSSVAPDPVETWGLIAAVLGNARTEQPSSNPSGGTVIVAFGSI